MQYATPSQDISVETTAGTPSQDHPDRPGSTEPTIAESVLTAFGGMALGGTVLWFLAPICFNC